MNYMSERASGPEIKREQGGECRKNAEASPRHRPDIGCPDVLPEPKPDPERDWLFLWRDAMAVDAEGPRLKAYQQHRIHNLNIGKLIKLLGEIDLEWPEVVCNEGGRAGATTWLYFIVSGPFTKVGISNDIDRRLHDLRMGNPHTMRVTAKRQIPARLDREVEKRVHKVLTYYAVGREWFRIHPTLARRIAEPIIKSAWRAEAAWQERYCARVHAMRVEVFMEFRRDLFGAA